MSAPGRSTRRGSIEKGLLRCPWHGWDYDPLSGKAPGFDDGVESLPVDVRDDGVYVAIAAEAPHQRTVSDLIVETLVRWGVRNVWGMVGHSNLGLADAIRRQVAAGEMRYVGIRHEGAAAFAASAYGKLTGRPAACFSIAGPGATNLLTGLWDANVDRSPVIALTGQVDTQVLGPGAFQEVDLQAAFGKVAQWSQTVLTTSSHAELANLAVKSATLNRGVSHLIFPDETQTRPAGDAPAGSPDGRLPDRAIAPPEDALAAAVELLRGARRPLIIVGHGARFDMTAIVELAEQLSSPVVTTFKGKGLIPDKHPLAGGVLGRSGTPIASWLMNESDALLVFGASFSNHTGITSKRPTVQVDYDPMTLGKFHAVDVPVLGEIGVTSLLLKEELAGVADTVDQRPDVAERWAIWRREKERRRGEQRDQGLAGRLRVRCPFAARTRGRDHRRRRRQQHVLVRTLLRMCAAVGSDVRLPGLDRVRIPGRDRRLVCDTGGRSTLQRPTRHRPHRRRRLRPSTWARSRPRSSTACGSPTCC